MGAFEDGPGDLTQVRRNLRWYPPEVWIYLLGCQWRRLAQEEPFVGRCGQVDDDLGSAIVAARLILIYVSASFSRTGVNACRQQMARYSLRGPCLRSSTRPRVTRGTARIELARTGATPDGRIRSRRRTLQPSRCNRTGRPPCWSLLQPAVPGPQLRPIRRGVPSRNPVTRSSASWARSTSSLTAPTCSPTRTV